MERIEEVRRGQIDKLKALFMVYTHDIHGNVADYDIIISEQWPIMNGVVYDERVPIDVVVTSIKFENMMPHIRIAAFITHHMPPEFVSKTFRSILDEQKGCPLLN